MRVSFDSPEYTVDITATGTIRLLEAIRETGIRPRFYQAFSSEMYGLVREVPQQGGEAKNYLFRIAEDPSEKNDLAAKNPELVKELGASSSEIVSSRPRMSSNSPAMEGTLRQYHAALRPPIRSPCARRPP